MAKKKKVEKPIKMVKLNLVGINGNAYAIMGAFQQAARRQGWAREEIQAVLDEATKSDYDHLLQTIIRHTESPEKERYEDDEYE